MRIAIVLSLVVLAGCSSAPPNPAVEKEGCHTPLGFIPEGQSAKGYLHQIESRGETCKQGVLTCENGVWAGAYIYPTCVLTP